MRDKKRFGRRLAAVALSVGLATAGIVGVAAPANAAIGECTSGKFCAWNNAPYTDYLGGWSGNNTNWGTAGNKATSIYNKGNVCSVKFWDGTNYSGWNGTLGRGVVYEQLAAWTITVGYNFDNRIESHTWLC